MKLKGFKQPTIPFVDSLPEFLDYYYEICKIDTGRDGIDVAIAKTAAPEPEKVGRLVGRIFLFTGGVCKECKAHIESQGGTFSGSYSKKVTDLIAKDKGSGSSKLKKWDGKRVWDWEEVMKL